MAVPKRKVSKSKRGMRRNHQKTAAPSIATCSECGEAKLPHNACPECGTYKGRSVVDSEE